MITNKAAKEKVAIALLWLILMEGGGGFDIYLNTLILYYLDNDTVHIVQNIVIFDFHCFIHT